MYWTIVSWNHLAKILSVYEFCMHMSTKNELHENTKQCDSFKYHFAHVLNPTYPVRWWWAWSYWSWLWREWSYWLPPTLDGMVGGPPYYHNLTSVLGPVLCNAYTFMYFHAYHGYNVKTLSFDFNLSVCEPHWLNKGLLILISLCSTFHFCSALHTLQKPVNCDRLWAVWATTSQIFCILLCVTVHWLKIRCKDH